jgi:hypothetical protein
LTVAPSFEISSREGSTRQAPMRSTALPGEFIGGDLPEVLDR